MSVNRSAEFPFPVGPMLICFLAGAMNVAAQDYRTELRFLSRPEVRQEIIERIARRPQEILPLLIEFGDTPPAGVNLQEFEVGLAEAFGRLRAPEGIPFLLRHLTLQRGLYQGVLHKSHISMLLKYPAMGALIEIGPKSLKPIAERLSTSTTSAERSVAVMIIGAIGGPEADRLLIELRSQTESELRLIDRELSALKVK